MKFALKLQQLRKRHNLTQEELAEAIFISRTAISKWESDRGYPSIESLKMISKKFLVSIDELLSSEELIAFAENDNQKRVGRLQDVVMGMLDCSIGLMLFLPFFGQLGGEKIVMTSLLSLTGVPGYIYIPYLTLISLSIITGITTLALQNFEVNFWKNNRLLISLLINILMVVVFIGSRQPYAAVFVFCLLLVKGVLVFRLK